MHHNELLMFCVIVSVLIVVGFGVKAVRAETAHRRKMNKLVAERTRNRR